MKLFLQLRQLLVGEVGPAGVEAVEAQKAGGVGTEAGASRRRVLSLQVEGGGGGCGVVVHC